MKLIIAGSRSFAYFTLLAAECEKYLNVATEVVSGRAPGADQLGERWAKLCGIPIKTFPARWKDRSSPSYNFDKGYDPAAGYARNVEMADYADEAILFWDGKSTGTMDMLRRMEIRKKPVTVVRF